MKIFYYIRRFRKIPQIEKRLLFKGILLASWIKINMIILPSKCYLNSKMISSAYGDKSIDIDNKKILIVKKTIKRVVNVLPWKINCVIKVILSKKFLNVLGIESTIKLSVKIKDNAFVGAHAYLSIDETYHMYKNPGFADLF